MKKGNIVVIAALLAILSACVPQRTIDIDVHSGTMALESNFYENSPPAEIREKDEFQITADIMNKGAYEIVNGVYSISIDESYMSFLPGVTGVDEFSLNGRSTYNPEGGRDVISLGGRARTLDPQTEVHTSMVSANFCYPYRTEGALIVCIDPSPGELAAKEKVCEMKTESFGGGQGGPVAVTMIEPSMLTHENPERSTPQFRVYLENLGNGQVVAKDQIYPACTGEPMPPEAWNKATVNAYLSKSRLTCEPRDFDFTKNDFVRCTLPQGIEKTRGAYTSPLRIEIDYGYTYTISKEVLIRKGI